MKKCIRIHHHSILFILFILTLIVYANHIVIPVGNTYASGKVTLKNISYLYSMNFIKNMDTLSFSNGTSIHFFSERDQRALFLTGFGGYFIGDKLTQGFFKYSDTLKKEYSGGLYYNKKYIWQFAVTKNNCDTAWNKALQFPQNSVSADSLALLQTSAKDTVLNYYQAAYFYGFDGPELPLTPLKIWRENLLPRFNSILYLKANDNHHFKIQVSSYKKSKFVADTNGYYLSEISVLWAVDSAGNKLFLDDFTPVKDNIKAQRHPLDNKITISINKNKHIMVMNNYNSSVPLSIYDLKGVLLLKTVVDKAVFNYKLNIASGLYLLKIPDKKFTLIPFSVPANSRLSCKDFL